MPTCAQTRKLQAIPMVKRANAQGRPCEILEGFWKDDPVGPGRISTAERSSHTGVFLTIQLTEAQNQCPVDAEVLRLNGPYYMFEQLLFCIYSSAITFQTT
ncbi:hypothetical protein N7489_007553 [Penicillium chrysogenum]|uniref:uncharacterized protein n=1 Tax=Penicillium chrysogenum TaxID=5076 RepID=UPI00238D2EC1|nr:uncharacterized protein N7489_007553 [Penicillium chrysogenum]KAJ5237462.1 hypothetical protein N7489_007553 [Penicillium chrysogenum]KAJ5277419.1 hypothetical protein N7524_003572 [Penicillium chrysogenum]